MNRAIMDGLRFTISADYDNVDWKKVIPILMAFAHKLLSKQNIRKEELDQKSYDFAMETILEYLEDKTKFEPQRNPDLLYFLKYNILRRLISNFGKSAYSSKVTGYDSDDLLLNNQFAEHIPIDENIDVKNIVSAIQKEINQDVVMSTIFAAKFEENMKRIEICEEFSIDTGTYDNAMKRLRRIAAKHLT